jgi:hypothetical protein
MSHLKKKIMHPYKQSGRWHDALDITQAQPVIDQTACMDA